MKVIPLVRLALGAFAASTSSAFAAGTPVREAGTSALITFHHAHPVTFTFAHILGIFVVIGFCSIVLSVLVRGPGERW